MTSPASYMTAKPGRPSLCSCQPLRPAIRVSDPNPFVPLENSRLSPLLKLIPLRRSNIVWKQTTVHLFVPISLLLHKYILLFFFVQVLRRQFLPWNMSPCWCYDFALNSLLRSFGGCTFSTFGTSVVFLAFSKLSPVKWQFCVEEGLNESTNHTVVPAV